MITFKQFLAELEQEPDKDHDSYEDAAAEYMQHCSQFPDIDHPLYRISGDSFWEPVTHYLKTRSPRVRSSESRGGTKEEQEYILSQPEWSDFPKRLHSIFCSTTKDFDVGSIDDGPNHERNLLMIFPFDGVKIAMLDDRDFNTMNILKGTSLKDKESSMGSLRYMIADCFGEFDEYQGGYGETVENLKIMKQLFLRSGKFDPEANGNEQAAKNYENLSEHNQKALRVLVTEFPQKVTPADIGAKLVTSSQLDLPGKTRECWFSGKYLSVPARDYPDFKAEVLKLQKRRK